MAEWFHALVFREPAARLMIDVGLIGHEAAVGMDMPGDDGLEPVGGDIRDVEAADPAIPLHQGQDGLLGRDRPVSAVRGLAADIGLVGFYGHALAADRRFPINVLEILHALTNPVR